VTNKMDGDQQARVACEQLLEAFYNRVDRGRGADTLPLFHPDGSMRAGGQVLQNLDELAAAMRARDSDTSRRTAHRIGLFDFTRNGDRALAAGNLSVHIYSAPDANAPDATFQYETEFALDDERQWRILAITVSANN
jgi:hypothetical protein